MTDLDDTRCAFCAAPLTGLGWPLVAANGRIYHIHADERACYAALREAAKPKERTVGLALSNEGEHDHAEL